MYKTRAGWAVLIDDPRVPQALLGTTLRIPALGDRVRVLRGQGIGTELEVVAVLGPVYSPDQKIYVDVQGDVPSWYHPWDVEVLPK